MQKDILHLSIKTKKVLTEEEIKKYLEEDAQDMLKKASVKRSEVKIYNEIMDEKIKITLCNYRYDKGTSTYFLSLKIHKNMFMTADRLDILLLSLINFFNYFDATSTCNLMISRYVVQKDGAAKVIRKK